SVPANGSGPVAALDGQRLRIVNSSTGLASILGPDGSAVATDQTVVRTPAMFLGDSQLGVANNGWTNLVVSTYAALDPNAFSMAQGGPQRNNAPPNFNSNYNSVVLQTTANVGQVWNLVRSFDGINAGTVASVEAIPSGPVSAVDTRLWFTPRNQ